MKTIEITQFKISYDGIFKVEFQWNKKTYTSLAFIWPVEFIDMITREKSKLGRDQNIL